MGVYQGLEHGWPRVHVQVDGHEHQSGWDSRHWQEALIGVYRKTIGSDLRGTPLLDDVEEEAAQAAPAARAGAYLIVRQ